MSLVTPISFPSEGWVSDLDPLAVPENAYQFAVNVKLYKQALAQRDGSREIPLIEEGKDLIEDFSSLNLQGAIPYVPSSGFSAVQFASKGEFILTAAGGRKFTLEIIGSGGNSGARLKEVTGGLLQPADVHMIWLGQAENFAIAGDDISTTWVYDSVNAAFGSTGYNTVDRENSVVPNRGRLPTYTNGRLAIVVDDRAAFIGDIIHGSNLTDASDLLKFVEQTYWAEGQQFVFPTGIGPIAAAYSLPVLGENTAHGDFIIEGKYGTYAIATDIFPRTAWIDTRMVRLISSEGGAQGQFAFDVFDNGAVRRTLRGVVELSQNKRKGDIINDPQNVLSDPIYEFLRSDYGPDLRLCSVKFHRKVKRLYVTVRHWLSGYHWQARGTVSYNYKLKKWEGVNTLPSWAKDIKILVPMRLDGEDRMFALCGGEGKRITLIEFDPNLREDISADGRKSLIESKVDTRAIRGDLKNGITLNRGFLQFSNLLGRVEYKLFWKSSRNQGCWNLWQEGILCHDECSAPTVKDVDVDEFPGNKEEIKHDKAFWFRIQWRGKADLRFFEVDFDKHEEENSRDGESDCTEDLICCTEDAFSYPRLVQDVPAPKGSGTVISPCLT